MVSLTRNSLIVLALVGAFGVARGDNNVNIIRDDQEKATTSQKDTTILLKDTSLARKDTLTDSARNAERQAYTPDSVGAIRPSETLTLQRRHVSKHFSTAALGPANFAGTDDKQQAYDFYLGQMWEVNPHAAIKAAGEVVSDLEDRHFVDVNLGSNLYATPTDFSPYVGGQLGMTYSPDLAGRNLGFNVGASLGAMLFRTASTQMNLEGNVQMVMAEEDKDLKDNPTIYALRAGVLF